MPEKDESMPQNSLRRRELQPVDLKHVHTFHFADRPVKVEKAHLAQVIKGPLSLPNYLQALPHTLKADDLRKVVDAIVNAYFRKKPIIMGIGGHVIKCGLSPVIIQLMEKDIITGIIMNGGASIHDFEICLFGKTSEDVGVSLQHGRFGMVYETGYLMNEAILDGANCDIGMGQSLGQKLIDIQALNQHVSILATAKQLDIPVMVHTAIGCETIHMHANADGAALGKTSFYDFRLLAALLKDIGDGGIYLNVGSAVILPEVFLKALNIARNISLDEVTNFVTVNMDMFEHYRPIQNVVKRPTLGQGDGYNLIGHHEIMLPLLANLVLAKIAAEE